MEKAKKRRFGIIASVLLSICIILGITIAATVAANNQEHDDTLQRVLDKNKIVWGVKADTKLFGLMNTRTNRSEGFDVDIAKAVTAQISKDRNIKIEPAFVQVTSNTRIQMLKDGNIDGFIATTTITPDRKKVIDFSKMYFNAGQSLLVKESSKVKTIKDLNHSNATIIGVVGSNSVENVKKYAPKAHILALPDYGQAMSALKAGQGDALTTDNGILYGMATENPGYKVVGGNFTHEPYGIAFDKDQGPMVRETNRALKEIRKNGEYKRIVKKWFSKVPGMDWRELLND